MNHPSTFNFHKNFFFKNIITHQSGRKPSGLSWSWWWGSHASGPGLDECSDSGWCSPWQSPPFPHRGTTESDISIKTKYLSIKQTIKTFKISMNPYRTAIMNMQAPLNMDLHFQCGVGSCFQWPPRGYHHISQSLCQCCSQRRAHWKIRFAKV